MTVPTAQSEFEGADAARPGAGKPAAELRSADGRSPSWRVLRQPRFGGYFAGSLLSNIGTWLQNTTQLILAYQLTHSAFAVGLVSMAQFAGFLVLGPWAAAIADRLGNRQVLIGTQVVSAGIAGGMALLRFHGALTEPRLVAGALGLGLCFTFALPVQTSMVSRLVPATDTKAAMAMNSVAYNAGRTLAPVLAVVLLATVGSGWAFVLNALSFAIFAIIIAAIQPQHNWRSARNQGGHAAWRLARSRPRIILLLAIVAAVTLAEDPVLVLGPSVAHQVLNVSSGWPAFFLSALGLGTVLGSIVPTKPADYDRRSDESRAAAVSLLILAVAMITFVSSHIAWLTILAVITAGAAGLLTGATAQSLLLKTVGPGQATQVMALWAVAWAGSKPIASLLDGWLGSHRHGVLLAGVVLALPAAAIALGELLLPPAGKERIKDISPTISIAKVLRRN